VLFNRATAIPLRDILVLRRVDLRAYGDVAATTLARIRRLIDLPHEVP
jgi:hypothetical protein